MNFYPAVSRFLSLYFIAIIKGDGRIQPSDKLIKIYKNLYSNTANIITITNARKII